MSKEEKSEKGKADNLLIRMQNRMIKLTYLLYFKKDRAKKYYEGKCSVVTTRKHRLP